MPEKNRENPNFGEIKPESLPNQDSPKKKEGGFGFENKREITQENIQEDQSPTIPQPQKTTKVQSKKYSLKNLTAGGKASSLKGLDEKKKVETLAMIAFERGINYSIDVAKKLKDPYILDALHDKLIGELREELIKRGELKDI